MKVRKYLSLSFIVISLFIASCDKIDFPYTEGGGNQNITNDTIRKVLIEDFTGHRCNNCPTAHKVAADLQKVYGKQLIVVAIHYAGTSAPAAPPYNYDFRVAEGAAIATTFGVPYTPIGLVNRVKQSNGGYVVEKGAFATEVSKQIDSLSLEPELYISLTPTFNTSDSTLNVGSAVTFLKSLPSGKYNLCIMITESNIIKPQKNVDPAIGDVPDILAYEHKHVLRGMLTNALGDEIFNGTPSINQTITTNFTNFKFKSDWKHEDIHVVAFVYYADGPKQYQIIQAQEVEL